MEREAHFDAEADAQADAEADAEAGPGPGAEKREKWRQRSAAEALFDSGYSSGLISMDSSSHGLALESRSSVDCDQDLESKFDDKLRLHRESGSLPRDLDSGVCIDSGLSLDSGSRLCPDPADFEERTLPGPQRTPQPLTSPPHPLSGYDAYLPDQDGDTPLHLAVIQGSAEVAFELIRIAPHPDFLDICNNLFQTPLHLAAITGQSKIVRRLIVAGACLDIKNRHGNTALHIACENGDLEVVRSILRPVAHSELSEARLLKYRLQVKSYPVDFLQQSNYEGHTCLHLVARNGNRKLMEYLTHSGANVDAQEGKSGRTALHWAVDSQKAELVQFLLKLCRANVNVRSYAGHTPLHLAWSLLQIFPNNTRVRSIIQMLKEFGGEPKTQPIDSDTDSDFSSGDEEDDEENRSCATL